MFSTESSQANAALLIQFLGLLKLPVVKNVKILWVST